ncbi:hypothetical protein V1514DRAFT_346561 [Lipomyces japonicus]|uniref:uncharacterized protein n=1 Tax=Lipomyces japonicus TaxID=56871 RepID=UPI0034CE8DCF
MATRRVALITGANGGLGFGIACRLLDSIPTSVPLTIVLTARYLRKVMDTISKLRKYAPNRDLLSFDYVLLDLGSVTSVLEIAHQLKSRYTHIDYVFLNAGAGDFTGVDWTAAVVEVLSGPKDAVTHPRFKRERVGRLSSGDAIGWVFQVNVLANYILLRQLVDILRKGGRVILISSVEAEIANPFNKDDIQLIHSNQPYVDSKKELELLHTAISKKWQAEYGIDIYLTHPGICHTSIFAEYLNWFTTFGMLLLFYIARWLGSPWHVVSSYNGALAPVWAALKAIPEENKVWNVSYGSACDWKGTTYVKNDTLANDQDQKDAIIFLYELDSLTKTLLERSNQLEFE